VQARDKKIWRCSARQIAPGAHAIIGDGDIVASRFERLSYLRKKARVGFSDQDAHDMSRRPLWTEAMGNFMRLSTSKNTRGRHRSRWLNVIATPCDNTIKLIVTVQYAADVASIHAA
jgi:hypothetical protein